MKDDVVLIPIDQIRVINPRHRDRTKFKTIVESIQNLGLKKPIQVSLRSQKEADEFGYDLVCGQGRIEACTLLGHKEIAAIVVEITKEERLLRSLVENMARRFPMPSDLLHEIERLKELGYSNSAIARKLDIGDGVVAGFLALKHSGEERLLHCALNGTIPISIAMEIAKTPNIEAQRELLKAYQNKQLTGFSIRTVKRLIEQRRILGKGRGGGVSSRIRTTADGMVSAYKKVSERQKAMIRKSDLCGARLTFIIQAFTKLTSDENFVNLLRAEGLATLPSFLSDKIAMKRKEGK